VFRYAALTAGSTFYECGLSGRQSFTSIHVQLFINAWRSTHHVLDRRMAYFAMRTACLVPMVLPRGSLDQEFATINTMYLDVKLESCSSASS
jgi:hypothetical protein